MKPSACDVLLAPSRDPAAETTTSKIWIGWLSPDYWDSVSFDTGSAPDLSIPFDEDELFLPLATSLVAAAQPFLPSQQQRPSSFESVLPEAETSLGPRVAALETKLTEIKDQLALLVKLQRPVSQTAEKPAGAVRVAVPGGRPKASAIAEQPAYPGLDPAVVHAALAAGIPASQLEDMSRVAITGKPRLPDLPRPPPGRKDPLSESEDEVQALAELDAPAGEQKETKLTAITQHLAVQKKRDIFLEALLDGSGSLGSSESSGVPASRKNAAALRALRKTLTSDPEKISRVIESNMEADFQLRRTGLPGSSMVTVSARAWLEARSRVQNFKTPVTLLWGIAGILDALRVQRPEEARARACLLLCQGDQLSIDKGSWIVAAPMSLEDPPPYAVFATHTLPTESESQVTKLIDSRWVDLFLHHLNEVDQLTEKKKKLAFKKQQDPPTGDAPVPKRGNKGKGAGKGSGSAGTGKEATKEKEAAQ